MGYILGYAAHCWELFGLRSWMPAYFAFSLGLTAAGTSPLFSAAALAGRINLLGPLASILGNEVAVRQSRTKVVLATMALHYLLGFGAGFIAPLAFGAVLDFFGGNQSLFAWGLAFVSLGGWALLAAAGAFLRRRQASQQGQMTGEEAC